MKSTWLMWIVGLLGGAATASARTAPTAPHGGSITSPGSTPVPKPAAAAPATPADPFAPFRVDDHQSIPPQPDMHRNGMQVSGSSSGPVNTEEPDRDFFTDPRFDQGGNCGRLFYHQFFLGNPHDSQIPERRVWFICWSPFDDGSRAQRLHERPGFLIAEVTTDGRSLQVHHTAYSGSGTQVDTLRWAGDALGHGRFETQDTSAPASGIADPRPFEIEPESWEPHLERARLHARAKDLPKAIADAGEAARKAPTDSVAIPAVQRLLEQLRGTDPLEASESDAD